MVDNGKSSGVQALSRGLRILGQFTAQNRCLSLSDLSHRTGLHRATVYRFAKTLESEGYLTYNNESGLYSIGPAWAAALYTLGSDDVFLDIITSDLASLAESTHEAVALGIRRGDNVQILSVMPSSRMFIPNIPGGRYPALWETWNVHAQIHLAFADEETQRRVLGTPATRYTENTVVDPEKIKARLAQISEEGLAFDHEEHAKGVCAMAVPMFANGKLMAALGLVVPIERFTKERIDLHVERLREAVAAMGSRLEAAERDWSSVR